MTTEAEKLARELDDFNASLDRKAAKMIRKQATEIERLKQKMFEESTAMVGVLQTKYPKALDDAERKDTLLREALAALKYHTDQTRPIERTFETMDKIKTELGEQQ